MKIYCECGHTIHDITDYVSYKARFVADQDYFDLCVAIENQIKTLAAEMEQTPADKPQTETFIAQALESVTASLDRYTKSLYQCTDCGRLFIDDAGYKLRVFNPQEDSVPRDLLRSIEGDKWKFPLRGKWNAETQGELWWGFGGAEEGIVRFTELEALKTEYFEVLGRLQKKEVLRDAFLRVDGEMLHQWP